MGSKRSSDHFDHDIRPSKSSKPNSDVYKDQPHITDYPPSTTPYTDSTTLSPNYHHAMLPPTLKSDSLPTLPILTPALALVPFTHKSTASTTTYERLEFLGDAYLELFATRLLYARLPSVPPRTLSTLRQTLVRNSTLALFARAYAFDTQLHIHDATRSAARGGRFDDDGKEYGMRDAAREKVLADVFEAYVAAVTMSGGISEAEAWMAELWAPMLCVVSAGPVAALEALKGANPKDELRKLLDGRGVKIEYLEEGEMWHTKDKLQQHRIGVFLTGWEFEKEKLGSAVGVAKKEAGMLAARSALEQKDGPLKLAVERKRKADEERKATLNKPKEE